MLIPRSQNGVFSCLSISILCSADRNYTTWTENGVITVNPKARDVQTGGIQLSRHLNLQPALNNPRAHLLLEASATALNNGNAGRSWTRMGVFAASQSGMHQLG